MRLVVYLSSEVEPFNIAAVVGAVFKREFPGLEIETADSYESMLALLPGAELLVTWKLAAEDFDKGDALKAVFTPAAGADWVAAKPGVFTFYGSFHGPMIGESLLAMMLYFNNQLDQAFQNKKSRGWSREQNPRRRRLLTGQKVLIIGYGNVGRFMTGQLRGLGMEVAGLRRSNKSDSNAEMCRMIRYENIEAELALADHVVLILPSGPETDGWFRSEFFGAMKESAFLYSFGRGNCMDEAVLAENLRAGNIAGAGLDVFVEEPLGKDSPLWELENIIITPHNSCCYEDYGPLFGEEAALALAGFLDKNAL